MVLTCCPYSNQSCCIYLAYIFRKLSGKSLSGSLDTKCFLTKSFCEEKWLLVVILNGSDIKSYRCSLLNALPMTAIAETSAAFLGSGFPNLRRNCKMRECQVFKSMLNICVVGPVRKRSGVALEIPGYIGRHVSHLRIVEVQPFLQDCFNESTSPCSLDH